MNIVFHAANDLPVAQRVVDGYLNATSMCQAHKKKINDWLRLESTLELVVALAQDLGNEDFFKKSDVIINCGNCRLSNVVSISDFPSLVIVKRGSPATGGGTWLHPDLAIQLAQWCNPKFGIQVSRWVREWMMTGKNPVQPPQPTTPPPLPLPALLPTNFMSAELSHEDELYQFFREVGKRELIRKFFLS